MLHSRTLLTLLASALALAACSPTSDRESRAKSAASRPSGTLAVRAAERADVRVIGNDTLSDSARVTHVAPEEDGDAVAFVFADPARGITSGLGITSREMTQPQLLWPDSVRHVWWPQPHALAFATSDSARSRLIVDVHAAKLDIRGPDTGRRGARPGVADDATRARARQFIDSLHVQPSGRPQNSALRYEVTSARAAPSGPLVAFYAVATDAAGARTNPAWYALDRETDAVAPIDEITGPAHELPDGAGGWTAAGSFIYAKGSTLWEAAVTRELR